MLEASEALILTVGTGLTSAGASWAAMRVTVAYMQRDIRRAQNTADGAHDRIDKVLGWPGRRKADHDEAETIG